MDPGWLVGGIDRRGSSERTLGRRRVAGRGGRRVRPLDARAGRRDRAAHERGARPPRCLRLARRAARRLPRAARARAAGRRVGPPGAARAARGPGGRLRRRAISCSTPEGSRIRVARARGAARGARRPQRARRRGRARGRPPRRRPGAGARCARSPTFTAPDAASSASAKDRGGAVVYDDYAHHPSEIAATLRAARLQVAGRAAPRGLPAAPVLAHAARSRATSGAPLRAPTWSWCSTSTRRASAPRTIPA